MSVLRHLQHTPLLLLGVACADPGAAAIARGNRAAFDGRLDDAVVSFQQACTEAPGLPRAHALLGNAFWAEGKVEPAQGAWLAALKLDPVQPDALLGLARIDLRHSDAAAAIERLSGGVQKAPARADLRVARALALLRRGADADLKIALEDSALALKAAGKDPDVLYTRGSVLTAAHLFDEAQAVLDTLEREDPRSALGPYGLARLAAAQSRKTDVMLHLRAARTASGSSWQPAVVVADPAFAFLKDDPDFAREVSGH
jgi:tetratricopeptide (TPR) repeat protein